MSDLTNYAGQIREEHRLAKGKYVEATTHAINCGRYLAEVKGQLPHGQFSTWVKENCGFSVRTGQVYMRLAEKAQRVAHLPIRQAMETLAAPRTSKVPRLTTFGESVDGLIDEWPERPIPKAGHVTRWGLKGDADKRAWLEIKPAADGLYDLAIRSYTLSASELAAPTPKWAKKYVRAFGFKGDDVRLTSFLTHHAELSIAPEYAKRMAWNIIASNFAPEDASIIWGAAHHAPYMGDTCLMRKLQDECAEVAP
jgi:hypothetical protein